MTEIAPPGAPQAPDWRDLAGQAESALARGDVGEARRLAHEALQAAPGEPRTLTAADGGSGVANMVSDSPWMPRICRAQSAARACRFPNRFWRG